MNFQKQAAEKLLQRVLEERRFEHECWKWRLENMLNYWVTSATALLPQRVHRAKAPAHELCIVQGGGVSCWIVLGMLVPDDWLDVLRMMTLLSVKSVRAPANEI